MILIFVSRFKTSNYGDMFDKVYENKQNLYISVSFKRGKCMFNVIVCNDNHRRKSVVNCKCETAISISSIQKHEMRSS